MFETEASFISENGFVIGSLQARGPMSMRVYNDVYINIIYIMYTYIYIFIYI